MVGGSNPLAPTKIYISSNLTYLDMPVADGTWVDPKAMAKALAAKTVCLIISISKS